MAWIRACGGGSSPSVPDGKTVTPINDVTLWQQCAGIANPTYTTLSEILADVGVLSTLMASDNAVDYLVRCKDWTGKALVPTMTSNTTPSGIASASSEYGSDYQAYKAFDNNDATWWSSVTGQQINAWVKYDFGSQVEVGVVKAKAYSASNQRSIIQVSNDDATWTDISQAQVIPTTESTIVCENTKNARYCRVLVLSADGNNANFSRLQFYTTNICDNQYAMQYIGANNYCANTLLADSDWRDAICNSTYIESVLNFKNPAMSSNTSPTGYVASASSQYDSTYYPAYKAFDNNDATGWLAGNGVLSGNLTLQLPTTHKMYCAFVKPYKDSNGTHAGDFNIVGSTDGVNWSYNLASDQFTNNAPYEKMVEIYDGNEYSYYRINILNSAANQGVGMFTVIFYGREDV